LKGSSYLLPDVPREKLTRLLSYFGSLFVFPLLVALVVGFLGHSATLGVKTFLLIELGMTVLIPLLNAAITSGESKPHRHRRK
jgi:hypothetical protein